MTGAPVRISDFRGEILSGATHTAGICQVFDDRQVDKTDKAIAVKLHQGAGERPQVAMEVGNQVVQLDSPVHGNRNGVPQLRDVERPDRVEHKLECLHSVGSSTSRSLNKRPQNGPVDQVQALEPVEVIESFVPTANRYVWRLKVFHKQGSPKKHAVRTPCYLVNRGLPVAMDSSLSHEAAVNYAHDPWPEKCANAAEVQGVVHGQHGSSFH
jgi:hypothetical protein